MIMHSYAANNASLTTFLPKVDFLTSVLIILQEKVNHGWSVSDIFFHRHLKNIFNM